LYVPTIEWGWVHIGYLYLLVLIDPAERTSVSCEPFGRLLDREYSLSSWEARRLCIDRRRSYIASIFSGTAIALQMQRV
jgi:hypothetical protein